MDEGAHHEREPPRSPLPPFHFLPSSPRMATSWPTTTVSSGLTRICCTTPALGARTSMVTLSVSIWAMTWSSSTAVPGGARMAATLPSVMDSPMAATRTSTAAATGVETRAWRRVGWLVWCAVVAAAPAAVQRRWWAASEEMEPASRAVGTAMAGQRATATPPTPAGRGLGRAPSRHRARTARRALRRMGKAERKGEHSESARRLVRKCPRRNAADGRVYARAYWSHVCAYARIRCPLILPGWGRKKREGGCRLRRREWREQRE